ncbi:MAG: FAD-binding protein, partial [Bacteroidales bacterium]
PYTSPMMIYPAVHYTMGGLWVDYELQTTIKGLFAIGEANFSDHGANRLGASALMQGLADGYFVLPYTIQNYLSKLLHEARLPIDTPEFEQTVKSVEDRIKKLLSIQGKTSVDTFHKHLGKIMWDGVGMGRNKESLTTAIEQIKVLREEFWKDVRVVGQADEMNVELEKALRLSDYLEMGELMAKDALVREESCGGHFREEYQTPEGEALRRDDEFMHVAAWEYKGTEEAIRHQEELKYEAIKVAARNYK